MKVSVSSKASPSARPVVSQLMQRWFLGPATTFRNAARTWIYLGFVGSFLALVAILSLLQPSP